MTKVRRFPPDVSVTQGPSQLWVPALWLSTSSMEADTHGDIGETMDL